MFRMGKGVESDELSICIELPPSIIPLVDNESFVVNLLHFVPNLSADLTASLSLNRLN